MIESGSRLSICCIKQRLGLSKCPRSISGGEINRPNASRSSRAHDLAIRPIRVGEERGETSTGRDFLRNSRLKFLLAAVLRPRPRIPFTDWIWHQLFITAEGANERARESARGARAAVINTDFPSVCRCIWKFSTGLSPRPPPPSAPSISHLPFHYIARARPCLIVALSIKKQTTIHVILFVRATRALDSRLARPEGREGYSRSVFSSR